MNLFIDRIAALPLDFFRAGRQGEAYFGWFSFDVSKISLRIQDGLEQEAGFLRTSEWTGILQVFQVIIKLSVG